MRIDDRLRRLEEAAASARDVDAEHVADADHLMQTVERLADHLPPSAATINLPQRIATMSPAQHCAWEMRFASEQTPIVAIMAMHGHPFPAASPENNHAPR